MAISFVLIFSFLTSPNCIIFFLPRIETVTTLTLGDNMLLLCGLFLLKIAPQSGAHFAVAKKEDEKGRHEIAQGIPRDVCLKGKENHVVKNVHVVF